MITKIKLLEKYCTDYTKIENYESALKSPLRYDLHHRREISENKSASDLIDENLYYHRPPEELIFLEHKEHVRLHNMNMSAEIRKKMSEAHKGKHPSAESRQKMSDAKKNMSAETRKRMSDAGKGHKGYWSGKHWHLENGYRIYTD